MVRRYALVAYWLLFALFTLYAAQHPGLVSDPEAIPYPWRGVVVTWAILAVATGILHAVLRPRSFRGQWSRLGAALLYSSLLLVFTLVTFVTDMPGYVYVPGYIALVTFVGLLLLAGGTVLVRVLRPARPNSAPPAA